MPVILHSHHSYNLRKLAVIAAKRKQYLRESKVQWAFLVRLSICRQEFLLQNPVFDQFQPNLVCFWRVLEKITKYLKKTFTTFKIFISRTTWPIPNKHGANHRRWRGPKERNWKFADNISKSSSWNHLAISKQTLREKKRIFIDEWGFKVV